MSENNKHITKMVRIIDFLKAHGSITSNDCFQCCGTHRLPAYIHEIKKRHNIETKMETSKDRYGSVVTYSRYYYRGEKTDA